MRHLFQFILDNYIEFYNNQNKVQSNAVQALDAKMKSVISRELPRLILDDLKLDDSMYGVKGSYGMGNYTDTPWISIYDKSISEGAQKGFYSVFLFKKDMSGFYLSINQGTTYLNEKFKGNRPINQMRKLAVNMREALDINDRVFDKLQIQLLSKNNGKSYEAANICAVEYEVNNFETTDLQNDINRSLGILDKIVSFIGNRSLDDVIDDLLYKEFIDDTKYQADISIAKPRITSNEPQKRKEKIGNGSIKSIWPRDPGVAKEALVRANFLCEIDNLHLTFKSNVTKENYVEAHHLIPMQSQDDFVYSLDVLGNIISLCPNCHREIHHAIDANKIDMLKKLYHKRIELLDAFGIGLPIEDLLIYYNVITRKNKRC